MPKFGLTMTAVLALAAPAWAVYPPPAVSGGYPVPVGYPVAGYAQPPDRLPPISDPMAPMGPPAAPMGPPGWYGPPGAMVPPGPGATDPCGFAFDPCASCDRVRPPRTSNEYWVRGDWLYWSLRDTPVPGLFATGNPNLADPAVPGRGNVRALGAGPRDVGMFHGARVTVGQWFDEDGELGAELSGFMFGREGSAAFFSDSTGTPVVSAPVLGPNGVPTVYDFAFPGQFTGSLGIRTATQLFGAEANLLHRWYANDDLSVTVDGLLGYRHLQLNERVELLGRTQATGGLGTFNGAVLPQGVTVFTRDSFRGRTEFHGGQIGARVAARYERFTLTAFTKGGVGANQQILRVDGTTTATGFGITRTAPGGIRALPGNIGRDTNTDFSMLGETGLELGLLVTKHVSLRVGYNALFWSDVLRPGNVIDPVVNFSQVPIDPTFGQAGGPRRPVNQFRSSDFLAHGIVVGVQFDY